MSVKFNLSEFKMDPAKQAEGVWVDFGGDAKFKIASLSNQEFQKAFAAKRAPYDKMRKELNEAEMLDIMVFCLARYVVLDWKGVFNNDEEVKYSVETAEEVLENFEWVRERVLEEARKISNFTAQVDEEIAKN